MNPVPATAQPRLLEADAAMERFLVGLEVGDPPRELARHLFDAAAATTEAAKAILAHAEGACRG